MDEGPAFYLKKKSKSRRDAFKVDRVAVWENDISKFKSGL